MKHFFEEKHTLFLATVGFLSWLVPGAGYLFIGHKKRAAIVFTAIISTFCIGIYIGSIGVVDLAGVAPFYVKGAQIMNTPFIFGLAHYTASGLYPVYGWPNEIGQIYTSTAGWLNLLCIVNAVYLAHISKIKGGD